MTRAQRESAGDQPYDTQEAQVTALLEEVAKTRVLLNELESELAALLQEHHDDH
jgi:hypothetical protein